MIEEFRPASRLAARRRRLSRGKRASVHATDGVFEDVRTCPWPCNIFWRWEQVVEQISDISGVDKLLDSIGLRLTNTVAIFCKKNCGTQYFYRGAEGHF